MKILHIVTLVTPTGAFGGPVRVAENQCRELHSHGHDVVIAGAYEGFDTAPCTVGEVPARLFKARRIIPRTGFSGICSPGLVRWLKRHVQEFDVVHLHIGRDLVTLPAAHIVRSRVPFVAQPHGMIIRSKNPLAPVLDSFLTRPILRAARAVFYLTPTERSELDAVAQLDNLHFLPNGVPMAVVERRTDRSECEVLFLARLHQRKRPDHFVNAAISLLRQGVKAEFVVAGPDEGMLKTLGRTVEQAGLPEIRFEGPVAPAETMQRLSRAAIYVLASVNEPFPMTVLEAMSVGTPVIVTTSCGLADAVQLAGAGAVIQPDLSSLISALRELLRHPADLRQMGYAGRNFARSNFSMAAVASTLVDFYEPSWAGPA